MRNTLLVFLLVLFSAGLSAQNAAEAKKPVGNQPLLVQNAVLKQLADNVNAAYNKLIFSAQSSRAYAIQAKSDFNAACDSYMTELKKEIALNNGSNEMQIQLNKELDEVSKLKKDNNL